jgi:hypothetical protein
MVVSLRKRNWSRYDRRSEFLARNSLIPKDSIDDLAEQLKLLSIVSEWKRNPVQSSEMTKHPLASPERAEKLRNVVEQPKRGKYVLKSGHDSS